MLFFLFWKRGLILCLCNTWCAHPCIIKFKISNICRSIDRVIKFIIQAHDSRVLFVDEEISKFLQIKTHGSNYDFNWSCSDDWNFNIQYTWLHFSRITKWFFYRFYVYSILFVFVINLFVFSKIRRLPFLIPTSSLYFQLRWWCACIIGNGGVTFFFV